MNFIDFFRDLVAQVPELVQPLIVAVAATIPYIEGEGAAAIGIIGGINPAIAMIAAILGNFICVAVLVYTGASARGAVITRQRRRRAQSRAADEDLDVLQSAGEGFGWTTMAGEDSAVDFAADMTEPIEDGDERKAARRAKFKRSFERYGVPGVSLLGPMLLPTHLTATMLVAAGIGRGRILMWQALAIIGWTVVVGVVITGVSSAIS